MTHYSLMENLVHYLYTATCYFPYTLLSIVVFLYMPALAIMPSLTRMPLLFTSIPFVSFLVINAIAYLLFYFNIYFHGMVLGISLLLCTVGFFRQYLYYKKNTSLWQERDMSLLVINMSIVLPLIIIGAFSTFVRDDAFISWNSWAQNYYYGISSEHISGGYPLFYPLWISYLYHFWGTTEYQGIVKSLFAIIPFTLLNCFAFSRQSIKFFPYLLVSTICIFPGLINLGFYKLYSVNNVNLYQFYALGYADPFLTAAITLAVLFLITYLKEKNNVFLILATMATIVASLTKQPGFLWALAGFPILLIISMLREKQMRIREIAAIIITITPVLIWLTGGGEHFVQNTGVIKASTGEGTLHFTNFMATFWHSVMTYWLKQPSLLLIYVWCYWTIRDDFYLKAVFWIFVIPGTLLWFGLGSYDIRLGLYLITTCGLLIAIKNYNPLSVRLETNAFQLKKWRNAFLIVGIGLFVFTSVYEQTTGSRTDRNHIYPFNASKNIIYYYFGKSGDYIYQNIFDNASKKLWIPSFYITPIFYRHNEIIIPPSSSDINKIYENILTTKPDYLFTSGTLTGFDASDGFQELVRQCPFLFKEIPMDPIVYHYRLFKLDYTDRKKNQCDEILLKNHIQRY